ncbi:uncharacterized protein LOC118742271 isoform X1 [Rhagoletis pomonella]|uniref:uncharacterized protein LOC118742271 isoform X1 n=1 Tax=Rhagoletis pomonella TaxID=28610 RepID=UPI0017877B68|nr:uncharacterized protein LOC118742271 isoform X1 [Rhagoletis pomonella]
MEGNTLKVDCSPGTLNRIRNDETFMRQKAAEILEEEFRTHGILFNEVIFASDEEQTQATPEIVESQNFSSEMAFSSLGKMMVAITESIVVRFFAKCSKIRYVRSYSNSMKAFS